MRTTKRIALTSVGVGIAATTTLEVCLRLGGDDPSPPKDLATGVAWITGIAATPMVARAAVKRLLA